MTNMTIFELIKNKENIQHLLVDYDLKEKTHTSAHHDPLNLLEYALISQNLIAFNTIIEYEINIQKKDSNYQISNLNDNILNTLFQNKEYALSYFTSHDYSLETKYQLMEKFAVLFETGVNFPEYGINIDNMISPEEILNVFKISTLSYQFIENLSNDFYNVFLLQNFTNSFSILKEILTDYHKNYPYFVLYSDTETHPYKQLSETINEFILNINNENEFNDFLLNELPQLLKNHHFKKIQYNENNAFLITSSFYSYVELFDKLQKQVVNNNPIDNKKVNNKLLSSINKIIQDELTQKTLLQKKLSDNELEEKLKNILIQYHLKNLVISKNIDVNVFIKDLQHSLTLVQDTYGLTSEQIGGNLLSLQFFDFVFSNMDAGLSPKGNLIMFGKTSLKSNLFNGIMAHEYSHYLQSQKYEDELVKLYSFDATKSLNHEKLWNAVYDKLSHNSITLDEAINYSIQYCTKELSSLYFIELNKDNISLFIKEHFLSSNYENAIDIFLSKQVKDQLLNTPEYINEIKTILLTIKHSYNQKESLNQLWSHTDSINKKHYLSNPFEIHSRLVEHRFSDKENSFQYGTKELLLELKPELDKFNHMIASHYKTYVLQKNKNNPSKNIKKIRNLFSEPQTKNGIIKYEPFK